MAAFRPNILMIVTDHQLYYRHGWDGGTGPMRPEFDRTASAGALFERAYAVTPLCGPARRSLLTGIYPHRHRNFRNQSEAPFTDSVYLDLLGDAGYRNWYYGKWHAGPGTALDHRCRGFSPPGYGNPYITEAYEAYLEEKGLPPAAHRVDHLFPHDDTARMFPDLQEGVREYRCRSSWCGETAIGITVTPGETHECFFLAHLACRRLEALAARKDERPFHIRVDFWGPHQPYFPTQEYLDRYRPEAVEEYGSYRDRLENKPEVYRNMNRPIADERGKLIIPSVFSWEQWQVMLAKAYAQSTMVDDAAGRIVRRLDELGLGSETLVVWTSDHGDALASHGGQFDKGSFMTEETVRIPLAVRYPGRIEPGTVRKELVNTIDIAPTLLDVAEVQMQNTMDGCSLMPLLTERGNRGSTGTGLSAEIPGGDGNGTAWRRELLLQGYGQGYRDQRLARTLVTERFKYTVNEDDIDELYDLDHDPFELRNLAGLPDYQALRNEYRGRLRKAMQRCGDYDLDPGW